MSRIVDSRADKKRWWHALDRTIFYPGGGGQAADEGSVNTLKVQSIREEDGLIWHLLEQPLNGEVKLSLNWPLRFRRMQQHSGQHLISAVFYREFDINTVSVHLGQVDTLIEFNTAEIPEQILIQAETIINEKIRSSMPIRSKWVARENISAYDLRRDIKVEGDPVRLIKINEYDVTGCGGTHVFSTSEIGLIKITGVEKIRSHTRVQFRIGEAAYSLFSDLVNLAQNLSARLSSGYDELEEKISKLADENRDNRRQIKTIKDNWLRLKASSLQNHEGPGIFVVDEITQRDITDFSLHWFEKYHQPCFFICSENDRYYFALRSPLGREVSASGFVKEYGEILNLKGGGSADFVRGVVLTNKVDDRYLTKLKDTFLRYFISTQVD